MFLESPELSAADNVSAAIVGVRVALGAIKARHRFTWSNADERERREIERCMDLIRRENAFLRAQFAQHKMK